MKRVVLDTNVTISAFFWDGHSRAIYNLIRSKKITMLMSKDMENEFIRVLGYSKFKVSPKEILPFIRNLRSYAEFVRTTSKVAAITSDPTDNIFIECAVDGKADYIISGDRHILDLGVYDRIQIVKPRDFLLKERFISE